MSIPVPIAVRVYRPFGPNVNDYITKYVDDFTFRTVIPGGFASMTITLRLPSVEWTPDTITGQATASGDSSTPNYIVVPDAQAVGISVGDRGWVYTDSTLASIRFNGARLRITSMTSAFGFTNIFFDKSRGITNTNNVLVVKRPGRLLNKPPMVHRFAHAMNRIQLVDTRNLEIVWEGRMEEPARGTDEPNVWQISCLGSSIAASDIQRPMWYIDSSQDNWHLDVGAIVTDYWWTSEINDSNGVTCKTTWKDGSTSGGSDSEPQLLRSNNPTFLFRWELARSFALYIARFHVRIKGWDSLNWSSSDADADGSLQAGVYFEKYSDFTLEGPEDLKRFNNTESEFNDVIGTDLTLTDACAVRLEQHAVSTGAADRLITTGGHNIAITFYDMQVQVQRKDRFGIGLTLSSHYNHGNYVTVPMVVEDVVGRFLGRGWDLVFDNAPYPGEVRPTDCYIDTSSSKRIVQMVYKDGATARDILADCMTYQPDAYWAIWESKFRDWAYLGSFGNSYSEEQFRFEWATWPRSWGYLITEFDEMEEQPSGEPLYNFVFLIYKKRQAYLSNQLVDGLHISWGEGIYSRDLDVGGFTRAITMRRDDIAPEPYPGDDGSAEANRTADQFRRDSSRTQNKGVVTVSRPVFFFDPGDNSNNGAARMLMPWQIKPGKLAKIPPLQQESGTLDFQTAHTSLRDTFTRSSSSSWGVATTGQTWSNSGGAGTDFNVNGNEGTVSLTNVNSRRFTHTDHWTDFDMTARLKVSALAVGASISASIMFRYRDDNNFYMLQLLHDASGTIDLELDKRVAGTFTILSTASNVLAYTANVYTYVRVRAVGNYLSGRVWAANTTEPYVWNSTGQTTEFTSGKIGTHSNLVTGNTNTLPITVTYDDFHVINLSLPKNSDGGLFKVTAVTYNSDDNKAQLELDNVANWNLPAQVAQ